MAGNRFRCIPLSLVLAAMAFHSARASASEELTVATAASVRFAMEDLVPAFSKASGLKVSPVYGASGALAAQIRNGAPFDVFVSADTEFPDSLRAWGFAEGGTGVYAYGKLVVWSVGDPGLAKRLDRGLEALDDPGMGKIALADPERAPYGREAVKALKRSGLYDRVLPRLVYGESISQVTQYVLTRNVAAGFTAVSVVTAAELRDKGHWVEVDPTLYDRIAQGAVVCRHGTRVHARAAARFAEFLRSAGAREILVRHGYGVPGKDP